MTDTRKAHCGLGDGLCLDCARATIGGLREAATFWRGTYATLKERSIHKDEDGAFWCLVCDMADKHASDCPLRDGFGPNAGKGGEDDG